MGQQQSLSWATLQVDGSLLVHKELSCHSASSGLARVVREEVRRSKYGEIPQAHYKIQVCAPEGWKKNSDKALNGAKFLTEIRSSSVFDWGEIPGGKSFHVSRASPEKLKFEIDAIHPVLPWESYVQAHDDVTVKKGDFKLKVTSKLVFGELKTNGGFTATQDNCEDAGASILVGSGEFRFRVCAPMDLLLKSNKLCRWNSWKKLKIDAASTLMEMLSETDEGETDEGVLWRGFTVKAPSMLAPSPQSTFRKKLLKHFSWNSSHQAGQQRQGEAFIIVEKKEDIQEEEKHQVIVYAGQRESLSKLIVEETAFYEALYEVNRYLEQDQAKPALPEEEASEDFFKSLWESRDSLEEMNDVLGNLRGDEDLRLSLEKVLVTAWFNQFAVVGAGGSDKKYTIKNSNLDRFKDAMNMIKPLIDQTDGKIWKRLDQ